MPKFHDIPQNSPEWEKSRLGIPTASEFCKIVTPAKGELSKQHTSYLYLLIAERLKGESLISIDNLEWIQRGNELEPDALRMYSMLNDDIEVKAGGFWTDDKKRYGASPDFIVGEKGLGEIKCPAPQTHIKYMVEGITKEYKCQIQGQLFVTEKEYCDFFSFEPTMPPVTIRIERDEEFITKLENALNEFTEKLDYTYNWVLKQGYFEQPAEAVA